MKESFLYIFAGLIDYLPPSVILFIVFLVILLVIPLTECIARKIRSFRYPDKLTRLEQLTDESQLLLLDIKKTQIVLTPQQQRQFQRVMDKAHVLQGLFSYTYRALEEQKKHSSGK